MTLITIIGRSRQWNRALPYRFNSCCIKMGTPLNATRTLTTAGKFHETGIIVARMEPYCLTMSSRHDVSNQSLNGRNVSTGAIRTTR